MQPLNIPAYEADQIRHLVLSLVPAEKIYLLATTVTHETTVSIFKAHRPNHRFITYHILVLLSGYEKSYRALAGMIRERSIDWMPVTALCMDIAKFLTWQDEGRFFACTVGHRAPVILG